jgi:hypothetical protein
VVRDFESEVNRLFNEVERRKGKKPCCGARARLIRRIITVNTALQNERKSAQSRFTKEELDVFEKKIKELAKIFRINFGGK